MSHKALLDFCYSIEPDLLWTSDEEEKVQFRALYIGECYYMRYKVSGLSSEYVEFGVRVGLNAEYIGAFGL